MKYKVVLCKPSSQSLGQWTGPISSVVVQADSREEAARTAMSECPGYSHIVSVEEC